MRTHHSYPFFFLFCLLTFAIVNAAASYSSPVVGGRTKVAHVESNKEVQSLGRFSVAQYNSQLRHSGNATTTPLIFSRVIEAETQVVSGIKYYLKVVVKDKKYSAFDAVVVVKPWLKSKELISFTPSPN